MNVAINGRFRGRNLSGVDRYATEVTARLGGRARIISPRRRVGGMSGHAWEQLMLPLLIARDEILWSPANSGPLAASRQVVTIHDTSVLDHPEWFAPAYGMWYRGLLPGLAARARHILTVSQHSKASISNSLGIKPARITVVPNAVDVTKFRPCEAGAVRRKYQLNRAYLLFVGSIDPRKNLPKLLAAWAMLRDLPEFELVIVGSRMRVFQTVNVDLSTRGVRYLGYVPDEDLPALYSGATAFVMPSLFEGFGLPVLEAMACGTPVIASTAGALAEVTGGAALPIDPASIGQIAEAMRAVLTDSRLRAQLSESGLARAHDFSWERSADQIWRVLAEHV